MWLTYAVLSAAFATCTSLLQRLLLRGPSDSYAYAFCFSIVGAGVSFPIMLRSPQVPHEVGPWVVGMVVGLLIVGNNLLLFRATTLLEASLTGALLKLRLVWVFVLGLVVLHTPFSWQTLFGMAFAIAAGIVIVHRFKRPESATGVWLVLSATLFNAAIVILTRSILGPFNVASATFFVSFLPAAVIIFAAMPHARSRVTHLLREQGGLVLVTCACGALTNLALNQALSLHDASGVLVIGEAFLVVVLVGEHVALREREQSWVKLLSVGLAMIGAILIDAAP